jgi:hypothetical protein
MGTSKNSQFWVVPSPPCLRDGWNALSTVCVRGSVCLVYAQGLPFSPSDNAKEFAYHETIARAPGV